MDRRGGRDNHFQRGGRVPWFGGQSKDIDPGYGVIFIKIQTT